MPNRKVLKVCPGCGKKKRIRTDRTYCSPKCASKHRNATDERRLVVAGDIHFPNHDPRAVELFLRWCADNKPTDVVINGDLLDCYKISRWVQPGSPGPGLRVEVDMGIEFFTELRRAVPRANILYPEGNHEFRLRAYLNNQASEVNELDHRLTISDQLQLAQYNVKYISTPGAKWFSTYVQVFDDLLVGHFDKISMHAAYAAKGLVEKYGINLITGHGHCMGMHHRTLAGREAAGYEGGCLCDLEPPYCEPHHWRQGFIVAHKRADEPVHIERVEILNHVLYYGGKRFSG